MSIHPDFICTGLEDRYKLILNTRMVGVPVINPEVKVQAVDFQDWNGYFVGVLITPWFMNLMITSCEGCTCEDLPVGSTQLHRFPSGNYEFIVGYEEGIGCYQSCSLFSPMFEFKNHEDAVMVAMETMSLIMDESNNDRSNGPRSAEIRDIWEGKQSAPLPGDDGLFDHQVATNDTPLSDRLEQPMNRRQLLRGSFLSSGKESHD